MTVHEAARAAVRRIDAGFSEEPSPQAIGTALRAQFAGLDVNPEEAIAVNKDFVLDGVALLTRKGETLDTVLPAIVHKAMLTGMLAAAP
jgi:hypothetical protein